MKVIKNNYQPALPEKAVAIDCPSCKSELAYTKEDLTHCFWRTEGWTNTSIKYKGFICPCCNYEIGIETLYAP